MANKHNMSLVLRPMTDKQNSEKGELLLDRDVSSKQYGYLFFHDDNDKIVFAKTYAQDTMLRHIENSLRVGPTPAANPDEASIWFNTAPISKTGLNSHNNKDAFILAKAKANGKPIKQGDVTVFERILPYSIMDNIFVDKSFGRNLTTALADWEKRMNNMITGQGNSINGTISTLNNLLGQHLKAQGATNPHNILASDLGVGAFENIQLLDTVNPSSTTDMTKAVPTLNAVHLLANTVKDLVDYNNMLQAQVLSKNGGNSMNVKKTGDKMTGSLSGNGHNVITGFKAVHNASVNDYAELFEKRVSESFEPGDVLAIDMTTEDELYTLSSMTNNVAVGVVSDEYGHLLGGDEIPEGYTGDLAEYNAPNYVPVGLAGRVHAYCSGIITKGAPLYIHLQMKGTLTTMNTGGMVVGIALETTTIDHDKRERVRILIK